MAERALYKGLTEVQLLYGLPTSGKVDMEFRNEGDWTISTPVYVGTTEDLIEATRCPHEAFVTEHKIHEEGYEVVLERCCKCVAVRTKTKQVSVRDPGHI